LAAAEFQADILKLDKSLPEGRLQPKLAALQDAIAKFAAKARDIINIAER
jgi:hypothetical protein